MCLRAAWKCSVGSELGDNTMSIKIQVTAVKRTVSSIQRTSRMTWNETGKRYDAEHSLGAEYESVQFMNIEPKNGENYMQVANVSGNVAFTGIDNTSLMLNDPALFGTFKAGDIVELRVVNDGLTEAHPHSEGKYTAINDPLDENGVMLIRPNESIEDFADRVAIAKAGQRRSRKQL